MQFTKAGLAALALSLTPIGGALAQDASPVQVSYSITSEWGAGFCGAITVSNTGTTAIEGWRGSFTLANGKITQLWNAGWSQSGSSVTVSGTGWTSSLAAKASISSIGFCADRSSAASSASSIASSAASSVASSAASSSASAALSSSSAAASSASSQSSSAFSSSSSSVAAASIALTTSVNGSNVTLSWAVANLATGSQEVYRDTDADPAGRTRIASLGASARTYSDSGLAAGTYYYWIKNTTDGSSLNSNAAAASVGSVSSSSSSSAASSASGKYVEKLDRGVVAIQNGSSVFISWRLLATESQTTAFNVYRGSSKLNSSPLTSVTNYTDTAGSSSASYSVRAVVNGVEQAASSAGAVWTTPYKRIALSKPAGGTTPDNVAYTYEANDGAVADLDGDGQYEIVLKWQPTNAKDNSLSGYTGNTLIDAYKLDGTRLWRIDLGRNIRAGAHYTQMVVFDLDGDGKAEVMLKTADGTKDGKGTVIGSSSADYRNSSGYILSGPEYLTVFNGQTGAAMATTDYLPARGTVSSWGDSYGNRVDRFLAGVAYLDGTRPSAVFARGYYTRAVLVAWDWRDGKLTRRWTHDSPTKGAGAYGEGAHSFSVADVNGDGKDDIVYGAATIKHDGTLLYRTGLGHGDALHVGRHNPNRSGQQVFMVHETPSQYGSNRGMEMHDAATGTILWGYGSGTDVGRGVCFDIDPAHPGNECWSTAGNVLMSAAGVKIADARPSRVNMGVWWDGDLSRELLDQTLIEKWVPGSNSLSRLLTAYNYDAAQNNGTKANPVIAADILGDWREEVIWRNADSTALLLFSTSIPSSYRFPTLMHDPQYRVQVAAQNNAYNQPPHPSFFLGNGMGAITWPAVQAR